MLARVFLLAALLAGLMGGPPQQDSGQKELVETRSEEPTGQSMYTNSHALIVGINDYPNLPKQLQLQFAAADAKAVRDVLVNSYGFPADQTKLLLNKDATLDNIRRELSQLASSKIVKPDDRILVYFSGHGQTVKLPTGGEMGFLIPSDAKIDMSDPSDIGPYLESCLPMKQIWDYLSSSPAKHACVIADACFSGMMASSRSLEMNQDTVSAMLARPARQVLTAGAKGQKTFERQDLGHGVFTYKFVEELKARAAQPGKVFSLMDLYTTLLNSVSNMTGGKQIPQFGNVETEGQVLFCSGTLLEANNNAAGGTTGSTTGGNPPTTVTSAKLTIIGTPANATLTIDGVKKSMPFTLQVDFPKPGERVVNIRVEAKGYIPAETSVSLKPGDDLTLPINLKELPPTPPPVTTASVAIDSTPQGATVFVDGAQVGVTPYALSVDLGEKATRKLKVRVEMDGYIASETTATVKRGDSISLPFNLKPVRTDQPKNHRNVKHLSLTQVATLPGTVPVNSIMFSPDGTRLAVSGMDYGLTLFDSKGGGGHKVEAPNNSVVRITPDWKKIVIVHLGILDGQLSADVTIEDAKTFAKIGTMLHVPLRSDTSVQDVYVGNSRLVLCGSIGKQESPTGFIKIADLDSGNVVTLNGGYRVETPASSADGSTYAAFMEPVDLRAPGSILVIPADLTKPAKQIPAEGCNTSAGIEVSKDGSLVALTCQRNLASGVEIDGTRIYDTSSGSQLQFLPKLRASAILGNGARLLGWRSQIGGPIVELLDAKTGDGLGEATGGEVWLSRDEKLAAQASPDGVVTVYRLTQP
ncbi:MAG TPA: caspase family protein [Fimbriimonadaceae bacterium]|nr:caspase family protein [Fimbriimonadaceae bacterium]